MTEPGMRLATLALAIAGVVSAPVAHADDRRDHSRLGVNLGLFTPAGELSVEYAQAIHEHVEISVTGGYGLMVRVGPQLALMPRLRARRGSMTASIGTGLSIGRYNNISAFQLEDPPHIPTLWSNTEVALQRTSRGGIYVRAAAGFGVQIAHGSYRPHDPAIEMTTDDVIPYGYLGIGVTL